MKLTRFSNTMIEVESSTITVLFSYKTPVACILESSGDVYITDKYHSKTTSIQISSWVGDKKYTKKPQSFFDKLQIMQKGYKMSVYFWMIMCFIGVLAFLGVVVWIYKTLSGRKDDDKTIKDIIDRYDNRFD